MRKFGLLLFVLGFLTAVLAGCFEKGKIADPERVAEAVRAFDEENLELIPVEREKDWVLEGIRPVRFAVSEPDDELDLSLKEQISVYVFHSEEHRIAGLRDFYRQFTETGLPFPRIYGHKSIMLLYWTASAPDEPAKFGEILERVINRLAGEMVYFGAAHAAARVLELRPEFPEPGQTALLSMSIGGSAPGLTVEGVARTEVAPAPEAGEEAYIVALVKEWNASIGGEKVVSTWRYRVTRGGAELVESDDQDWRLELIK